MTFEEKSNPILKLDIAVSRTFKLSRKQARQKILAGQIRLNGRIVRIIARPIKPQDTLVMTENSAHTAQPKSLPAISILYEDEDLLIINKPAHLLSEKIATEKASCVQDVLFEQHRIAHTHLVHRLDAGTSGVMMLAKNQETAAMIFNLFQKKHIQKTYHLIAQGVPDLPKQGIFDGKIARNKNRPNTFEVNLSAGKTAYTQYRLMTHQMIDTNKQLMAYLFQANPITGRTHQIRVHFKQAGLPLLGDALYGGLKTLRMGEQTIFIHRPLLHAYQLQFKHPHHHQEMCIQSPWPTDFQACAQVLFQCTEPSIK